MTRARKTLVCVETTPYYHCFGRCVRRAFLCGKDTYSGRSYEHRRAWIQERLAQLTRVFAIDLCAYALMSNHYHLVLRLKPERCDAWSDIEVVERWMQLFAGTPLMRRYAKGEQLSQDEQATAREIVGQWRRRLSDLSWFMRCLNEHIARRANAEDGCTGHFWEARFRSQALLDDIALLRGMVYVDLNPIRASLASTIEDSHYTAARQRFEALIQGGKKQEGDSDLPILAPFFSDEPQEGEPPLPFRATDYLELLDTTSRCCVQGKRGFVSGSKPRLIERLGIDAHAWLHCMVTVRGPRHRALGSPGALRQFAATLSLKWVHGISQSAAMYPT